MNGLTSEERNALNILCRDDGYTVVNHDLTLLTSNMNSPNFGAITDVLLKSAALVGKELEIEEVPQVTIDKHFSQHNEQATEKQKRQNKTDKNAVYQTLVTLCQTAVDANASDVHVLTSPDSTLFLQRIYGVRRLIKRFHNKNNALNQPLDVGLALIDYIYSTLGSQDIQYTRPANDRFKLPLKVDGEEREFEWRAA
ncbi:general secretion pathway protein E [Vibrio ishigakensis]|uniref:General secretion pathway protein E n=1 Tax=Vibrio ishigakensis TaxID=1481914 RepID=A0A0B8PQS0_9VIBR|nr:general secretion pathway protein E [Vibrio ishigakensis]